jgi:hypothetical protein
MIYLESIIKYGFKGVHLSDKEIEYLKKYFSKNFLHRPEKRWHQCITKEDFYYVLSGKACEKITEIPLLVVKVNNENIKSLSELGQTDEVCEYIIKNKPDLFKFIINKKDEYINLLLKRVDNIKNLPLDLQKIKHVEYVIKKNGTHYLKDLNENLLNEDLVIKAIKNDYITFLYNIPRKLRTKDVCLLVIKKSRYCFEYVPDDLKRDKQIREEIIKKGEIVTMMIKSGPKPNLGEYIMALDYDYYFIRHLPKEDLISLKPYFIKKYWDDQDAMYMMKRSLG